MALYRHSKTDHLYTVLWQAISLTGPLDEGEELDICLKFKSKLIIATQGCTHDGESCKLLCQAVYCGKPKAHLELGLIIYTGHYNNPRGNKIYSRPVSEWNEETRYGKRYVLVES